MKTLLLLITLSTVGFAHSEEKAETLKKEIHQKKIEIVNTETQAQDLLQTNWKQYAEKIEEVERKEEELQTLESQLQELEPQ